MGRILVLDVLPLIAIGGRLTLDRDIGPGFGIFAVDLDPLGQVAFGIGQNRLNRAFGLTYPAIDAFIGIDDEKVFALVEAIDRANLDTVHVLALDAVFGDDVRHASELPLIRPHKLGQLDEGSLGIRFSCIASRRCA